MRRPMAAFVFLTASGWLAVPAAAQKSPEPTAEQVAKIGAECRKQFIFGRLDFNPATRQLEYLVTPRGAGKTLPEIPFAHILRVTPEDPAVAFDLFDPARPNMGIEFASGTRLIDLNPKKLRAAKWVVLGRDVVPARDLFLLESVETLSGPFGDAEFVELKRLKALKSLSTSERVGVAGFKALPEFPALERLRVTEIGYDVRISDGFVHLKDLKRLKQLALHNVPALRERTLDGFGTLPALTHLELRNVRRFPSGLLEEIGKLPALTHLELRKVSLFDDPRERVGVLEQAKSLVSLTLAELDLGFRGERFSFGAFPALTELSLEGRWATDEWLKPVEDLRNVSSVSLLKTEVSNGGLRALARQPLRSLIITQVPAPANRGGPVSGPGVGALVKDLRSLAVLGLDGVPLFPPVTVNRGPGAFLPGPAGPGAKSDPPGDVKPPEPDIDPVATKARKAETVAALKTLSGLRYLNLNRAGVTDEDADWLAELKGLEYLYVGSKVTATGLAKIKAALPNCAVAASPEFGVPFGMEPPRSGAR